MDTITDTQDKLPPRAGEALTELLRQFPKTSVLLMFSGGSALTIIDHIDAEVIEGHVTLSVLDERFGVFEDESNFAQLESTDLYKRAIENGAFAIDPRGIEGEDLEETANWFDATLRAWRQQHPDGVICITQGVGADGHTAGILPRPDDAEAFAGLFVDTDRFVVGYDASNADSAHPARITVTPGFLERQVTSSVVYAVGDRKREVLQGVIHGDDQSDAEFPARVISRMNDVLVFTDQAIE